MPIIPGSQRNDVIVNTSGYYISRERCTIMGADGADALAASNFGIMEIWAGNTSRPGNPNNVDQIAASRGDTAILIGDNDRTHFMASWLTTLRIQDGTSDDSIDIAHMNGTATLEQGGGSNTVQVTDVNQLIVTQTGRSLPIPRPTTSWFDWSGNAPEAPPLPVNDYTLTNVRHVTIHGSENNDIYRINGNVGNGTIDGGAGSNIVMLDGNLSDYRLTRNIDYATGQTSYILQGRGSDSITLTNITAVKFRDQDVGLTDRHAMENALLISNQSPPQPPMPTQNMPQMAMNMDNGQIGLLPSPVISPGMRPAVSAARRY